MLSWHRKNEKVQPASREKNENIKLDFETYRNILAPHH